MRQWSMLSESVCTSVKSAWSINIKIILVTYFNLSSNAEF